MLSIITKYQSFGGFSVPNVLTAIWNNDELNNRQSKLVDFIVQNDIPACENPLRLLESSKIAKLLRPNSYFCVPPADNSKVLCDKEVYCGALYREHLPLPPYYSMKSSYSGLTSNKLSELTNDFINSCWDIPIPTHQELLSGVIPIRSPKMSLIL